MDNIDQGGTGAPSRGFGLRGRKFFRLLTAAMGWRMGGAVAGPIKTKVGAFNWPLGSKLR